MNDLWNWFAWIPSDELQSHGPRWMRQYTKNDPEWSRSGDEMFGNRVMMLGNFGDSLSLRSSRYDTIRIFARTVGERDPGGEGLSWGKHRVTTRGWARIPPRPPVLAYDSINILLARHSTLLRRTIEWHAGLGGSYSLDTREKRESYWFIAFDIGACKCIF